MKLTDKIENSFLIDNITSEQRSFLSAVLNMGIDFLEGKTRDNKVLIYKGNEDLKKVLDCDLPKEGVSNNEILNILKNKILKYSISQHDNRYLSFPDTGNSISGIAGDILNSFLNQNMIAVERSAPIATFVEIQLILWLREIIGYPTLTLQKLNSVGELGGLWTSGGNMSNHIAILAALHNKFPQVKEKGLASLKNTPSIVLAGGVDHFSFKSAAKSLGIGEEGLIWATANSNYTTNTESVEMLLKNSASKNTFMVVAVAGNCRTTSIDNLIKLSEICKKYNVWFHIDACHGGSLLFSEKLRKKLGGIEYSDSVSIDPHKGLFVTYPSSYVLFKNPDHLTCFSRYPDKTKENGNYDLGLITPFYGSRGFDSLKLWLLIKQLGITGLGKAIEKREDNYLELHHRLEETSYFVFLNKPTFYRSAFVFCPSIVRDKVKRINCCKQKKVFFSIINKYTKIFCDKLYQSGQAIFDLFQLEDRENKIGLELTDKFTAMALAVGHPFIKEETKQKLLDQINIVASELRINMLDEIETTLSLDSSVEKIPLQDSYSTSPASW
ncbi:pyridoxal phosphate-dependent decarboxylase family protein [Bacillus velezensis]|uniref:pyridoxal phosphate-dependent decarboxylase family protein n=1 Tax=Bacillus velezensis TaxID=492670 RepID=UPI0039AFDD0A